ncbi:MAG: CHAT domain-containing protein [Bryobacteraceae bacterium]
MKEGRTTEALAAFQLGSRLAKSAGNACLATWFLNNQAGTSFGLYRYRDALATYLEEKPWAERCGDRSRLGILLANIASLYTATGTGDLNAAAHMVRQAMPLLADPANAPHRVSLLITGARIDAMLGNEANSISGFHAAIEEAARYANPADKQPWAAAQRRQVTAWKELGEELLRSGRYQQAEYALDNAYRLQVMNSIPPSAVTYRLLAELRRIQGDLPSAERLIERALQQAVALGPRVPLWRLYYERGRIRLAQGRAPAALKDFETSIGFIRRYRLEFLPGDAFRISNENYLQDVFSAYVRTCNQLYFERNVSGCALTSFEIAEENRAVSLRSVFNSPGGWRQMLNDRYLDQLNELENAENVYRRRPDAALRARVDELHSSITEEELKAGLRSNWLEAAGGRGILAACRAKLRHDEVVFSFFLSEQESYRWTVTAGGLSLHRLPPIGELQSLAQQFTDQVRSSSPSAQDTGRVLYNKLFGNAPAAAVAKRRWILVLDRDLFQLPYAALVVNRGSGRPVYLIERHSLQQIPAASVLATRPSAPVKGRFLALGDPVYNRADHRFSGAADTTRRWPPSFFTASASDLPAELPRLPGSGKEIETCARIWSDRTPFILSGMAANTESLALALRQPTSILHVAAHFLPSNPFKTETRIALSLDTSGRAQSLGERDIYSRSINVGTVVLSGCGSGSGTALPSSGLLGMTRAWLASGAHSVAASLWSTADDTGDIFSVFYRELRNLQSQGVPHPEPLALQRAQLALLSSQTWRARPVHWAAYFLVTKD